MNNKELAIDVIKHPLIQEILKQKLAESSVVNRLIVEEIMMEDELEEVKSDQAKLRNIISTWFREQKRKNTPIDVRLPNRLQNLQS